MKQTLSFELTISQTISNSIEATLSSTISFNMPSSANLSNQSAPEPVTDNDNPFLANSDDEEHSERESESSEGEDSDSDTDTSHIEGVRKLSEIRFPSRVDGLVAPGIKCSRDKEAKTMSMKQAERLRNITNDDPLRTPEKMSGTSYSDANQQSDTDIARTPQKSTKRSRPEEDYVTPTKSIVRTPPPFGAPLIGYDPKYIPKYARSRTKPTKFSSTTPTKVCRSPNRKQSSKSDKFSRKASPFHFSKLSTQPVTTPIASPSKSSSSSSNTQHA
ncbi:hypothetical protein K450DRAFT_241307 [Umbelopsis ramanniana AG]|uniref:Uncharacterized protein n=1 Tax=Umbelopsis ramanniana AG TaxID=1314678 RepID=A0AAD5EA41_UMBRA|nr:uncharacterized protein K450DRAFT_241307 [Umbelopsis ramanniana AG]KAI8579507.1 hypothetical protein K450DRAFT_241307 [Umbelopsis ramanniana AG]